MGALESLHAGMNSSERLFVLGIAGMIAAVVLLVVLILVFRWKAGRLNRTLDEEFGEERYSGKPARNSKKTGNRTRRSRQAE